VGKKNPEAEQKKKGMKGIETYIRRGDRFWGHQEVDRGEWHRENQLPSGKRNGVGNALLEDGGKGQLKGEKKKYRRVGKRERAPKADQGS